MCVEAGVENYTSGLNRRRGIRATRIPGEEKEDCQERLRMVPFVPIMISS